MSTNFMTVGKGISLRPQSSDPATASTGDFYYNTTSGTLRVYNGTSWGNILSSTGSAIFTDSNFIIQNNADNTKKFQFLASSIPTATTTTLTVPSNTTTLIGRTSLDQGANRLQTKDLDAGSVQFVDPSVNTKTLSFQTSGASTSGTSTIASVATGNRIITLPDITDTLVSRTNTETLSNKQVQFSVSTDSTTTGSDATIQSFTTGLVRLTNASLASIGGIPAGSSGQFLIIENKTGVAIVIQNEDAAITTAANRIQTGSGAAVSMSSNATFTFTYDTTSSRWQLLGNNSTASTVFASYYCSTNQSATTSAPINFDTKEDDSHNAVTTGSGWRFTAPLAGLYIFGGGAFPNGGATLLIYKNSTAYKTVSAVPSAALAWGPISGRIQLAAGDFIEFRPNTSVTYTGGTLATAGTSTIFIQRIGN